MPHLAHIMIVVPPKNASVFTPLATIMFTSLYISFNGIKSLSLCDIIYNGVIVHVVNITIFHKLLVLVLVHYILYIMIYYILYTRPSTAAPPPAGEIIFCWLMITFHRGLEEHIKIK
jgi:hypothetical protein